MIGYITTTFHANSSLFIIAALGTGASDTFQAFVLFRITGGIGIGLASNLSPMYIAEITPAKIRGAAMAVSTVSLWLASFILVYVFPVINKGLGTSGAVWLYGAICIAGFLFIRRKLVETKGRSLEEIEKELVGK